MIRYLKINPNSITPVYQQIADGIEKGLDMGHLQPGMQVPPINEIAKNYHLSAGTVIKAYQQLKEKGVIESRQGKGFFITIQKGSRRTKVMVVYDRMNAYKEVLYNSIAQTLGKDYIIHLYFHHYNLDRFEELINDYKTSYDFYILMPHFYEDASEIMNTLPPEKIILLDNKPERLKEGISYVIQDFRSDIYKALDENQHLIQKYKEVYLISSSSEFQFVPTGIIKGFEEFGKKHHLKFHVVHSLKGVVKRKRAYVVFTDNDMVHLLKKVNENNWIPGKDIGIISYDDTPVKEILNGGISVITTDFKRMGERVALILRDNILTRENNPVKFIHRGSI